MSDTESQWQHICEVCGVEKILTPGDAFDLGWDYPPRMGQFGVVGPRCCPRCLNVGTVWWALAIDGYTEDMLTEAQRATVSRIAGEPHRLRCWVIDSNVSALCARGYRGSTRHGSLIARSSR